MSKSKYDSTEMAGKLVLIIGPSGVGKSVVLKTLRQRHPEWHVPRSATTRAQRDGEGEVLYRFVSDSEFDTLVQSGEVLEWAVVHGGARYGTLKDEIIPAIDAGKTVVREVDVQGFDSIRTHELFRGTEAPYRLQSIFVLPEHKEQLIARIRERAPISDEELRRRIASMERELTYAELCDLQVKNKEGALANTVQRVESAIVE